MPWWASTTVTATNCHRCDGLLLVALEEGIVARVDAHPIPRERELESLLAGKRTYTHARHQLIFRDPARIRSHDPDPIHAEHQCPRRTT
jgi:hypothetical protein